MSAAVAEVSRQSVALASSHVQVTLCFVELCTARVVLTSENESDIPKQEKQEVPSPPSAYFDQETLIAVEVEHQHEAALFKSIRLHMVRKIRNSQLHLMGRPLTITPCN